MLKSCYSMNLCGNIHTYKQCIICNYEIHSPSIRTPILNKNIFFKEKLHKKLLLMLLKFLKQFK